MSDTHVMRHLPCGCEIGPQDIARQRRTHSTPHQYGDVCRINESVHAPILDILTNFTHLDSSPKMPDLKSARQQLFDPDQRPTKKHRPCIYMGSRRRMDRVSGARWTEERVCITASYENTLISQLPVIYQHFSLAIHPHHVISQDPSEAHVHPTPCWGKRNVWVVTWQYETMRRYADPWRLSEREKIEHDLPLGERVAPFFDDKAITFISDECDAHMLDWEKKCLADPDFAKEREREFWDHWNDPARKFDPETTYSASNASVATQLSRRNIRPSGDFSMSLASINEAAEEQPRCSTANPYLMAHTNTPACTPSGNGYNGAQSNVIPGVGLAAAGGIDPSTPYVPPHRRSSESGAPRVGVSYRPVKPKRSAQSIQSLWSVKSIRKVGQRLPGLPRRRGSQGDA